jgi:hypothetical protein
MLHFDYGTSKSTESLAEAKTEVEKKYKFESQLKSLELKV